MGTNRTGAVESPRKSYGQFCALARSLDHVGDRWTLLIVRELLIGEATYGELAAALPGVATNLLAERLRQLEADGLVERAAGTGAPRRRPYRLTDLGAALEPAVLALIRWGSVWMTAGPGDDHVDDRWAFLALRALLVGRTSTRAGQIAVRMVGRAPGEATTLVVDAEAGRPVAIRRGDEPGAPAQVDISLPLLLGLVSGELTMAEVTRRGARVRGDRRLARALLVP